jgi:hypothetical protein
MLEGRLVESENRFQQHRQEAEAQVHRLRGERATARGAGSGSAPAPAVAPPPPAPRVRPPPPPRFAHPTKQNTTGEWLFQVEMHFLATGLDDLTRGLATLPPFWMEPQAPGGLSGMQTFKPDASLPSPRGKTSRGQWWSSFTPPAWRCRPGWTYVASSGAGRVQASCRIFQRLVTQVPSMDQGTIVDTFVHGLKDHVRAFVRQRRPRTCWRP